MDLFPWLCRHHLQPQKVIGFSYNSTIPKVWKYGIFCSRPKEENYTNRFHVLIFEKSFFWISMFQSSWSSWSTWQSRWSITPWLSHDRSLVCQAFCLSTTSFRRYRGWRSSTFCGGIVANRNIFFQVSNNSFRNTMLHIPETKHSTWT